MSVTWFLGTKLNGLKFWRLISFIERVSNSDLFPIEIHSKSKSLTNTKNSKNSSKFWNKKEILIEGCNSSKDIWLKTNSFSSSQKKFFSFLKYSYNMRV